MRHLLILLFSFTTIISINAQDALNLRQAIDLALTSNLELKQAQLGVELAATDVWQARGAYLPSLNGFAGHTWNYGRTIDPFTNQFATNTVQSNNFGLNSSFNVFSGFQNHSALKQAGFELQASRADLEKARNDLVIAVTGAYMQVLFSEAQVRLREEQYNLVKLQEERISRLVETGALAHGSLYDIQSQLAAENLQLVTARNNAALALLNLRQLLNIPASQALAVADPALDAEPRPVIYEPGVLNQKAQENMPEIEAAELRLSSAEKNIAYARGLQAPRLILSAGLGTGYSELRSRPVGEPIYLGEEVIGYTASAEPVFVPNYTFELATIPFSEQVSDNLNRSVSFSLNVPILNGLNARTMISRAKIGRESAQLNLDIARRELEKSVQQAYTDATGAYTRWVAATSALQAAEQAFRFIEQRFNLGAANTVEYREARNLLSQAESELLQSRYEYYFKKGILDFYNNNTLTF